MRKPKKLLVLVAALAMVLLFSVPGMAVPLNNIPLEDCEDVVLNGQLETARISEEDEIVIPCIQDGKECEAVFTIPPRDIVSQVLVPIIRAAAPQDVEDRIEEGTWRVGPGSTTGLRRGRRESKHAHSAVERSVGYVLMHWSVCRQHLTRATFQTVSLGSSVNRGCQTHRLLAAVEV